MLLECTPDVKWGGGAAISLNSKLFVTGKHPGRYLTGHSLQELIVEFRDCEHQAALTPTTLQHAGSISYCGRGLQKRFDVTPPPGV